MCQIEQNEDHVWHHIYCVVIDYATKMTKKVQYSCLFSHDKGAAEKQVKQNAHISHTGCFGLTMFIDTSLMDDHHRFQITTPFEPTLLM